MFWKKKKKERTLFEREYFKHTAQGTVCLPGAYWIKCSFDGLSSGSSATAWALTMLEAIS